MNATRRVKRTVRFQADLWCQQETLFIVYNGVSGWWFGT